MIRALPNAVGKATATRYSTLLPRALNALQPLSPLTLRNRAAQSLATPLLRLSKRLTCLSRSQRSRRSPSAQADPHRSRPGLLSQAALVSRSLSRLPPLYFLYASTVHVSSSFYRSALDATSITSSALGTRQQQHLYCTIFRNRIRFYDCERSAFCRHCAFEPTVGLLLPLVGPIARTVPEQTTLGSMYTGQHCDAFTSWSHSASATGQSPWIQATEVFLDKGPSAEEGPSAFGSPSAHYPYCFCPFGTY